MKTHIGSSEQFPDAPDETGFGVWIERGEWYKAPFVDPAKFGPHSYAGGVGECSCGCRMGACSSSGPVDPFGACPSNPKPPTNPTREATREAQPSATPRPKMGCGATQTAGHGMADVCGTPEWGPGTPIHYCPKCIQADLRWQLQQANARERDLKDELAKRDAEIAKLNVLQPYFRREQGSILQHHGSEVDRLKTILDDVAGKCSIAQKERNAAEAELARLKAGSGRSEEYFKLLGYVHDYFVQKSPEHYKGCGLWIDVHLTLGRDPQETGITSAMRSGGEGDRT